MNRWSVFSSADDALVRVEKQAGMVTMSPLDRMSFSVFRVKLCGKWCIGGGIVHPFFRSNNVAGILIWEEIYILIIWFIILDPRQDLLVTYWLFVVASSMPGTVNTYTHSYNSCFSKSITWRFQQQQQTVVFDEISTWYLQVLYPPVIHDMAPQGSFYKENRQLPRLRIVIFPLGLYIYIYIHIVYLLINQSPCSFGG